MAEFTRTTRNGRWAWSLLLIIPFVALLWVPFYNSVEPSVWGIPFFYWYQFLWVILTSLIIVCVRAMTTDASGDAP
jgi:Protein of unknown function (DUF3311)